MPPRVLRRLADCVRSKTGVGAHWSHTDARLAAIVASSDDAIISKDLNGYIMSWNGGAESMFGDTPEEAVGKAINPVIPPERPREETNGLFRNPAGPSARRFQARPHPKQRTPNFTFLSV